jgi:hypothetical protein
MRNPLLRASLAAALLLAACAKPSAPAGKWEGFYEDEGLIVAVRLEIDAKGTVRVSAPNAVTDKGKLSPVDRAGIRAELTKRLGQSWNLVQPLPLEFDGEAFRKPGGVAPQLEWDAEHTQMTMIYYSANRPSVRVKLAPVEEFGHS